MNAIQKPRVALVLSGGGTRGAYEAGVVHYIRTMLPRRLSEEMVFHILCGSSVGAINIVYLAATSSNPSLQGRNLVELWKNIKNSDIYKRGPVPVSKLMFRSVLGILTHLIGLEGFAEPDDEALKFQGLLDTQPFFQLLRQSCPWQNITRNIETGWLDALAISATNMVSGELEIFLQKSPDTPHSDRMVTRLVKKVSPRHVMASAALPLLFPPVPIQNVYYNDGSMRLNTPLAPAVACGATRILIVGTRHRPTKSDQIEMDTQARIAPPSRPTLGQILGKFYNSIFLDRVETDRDQLDRINRILKTCEELVPEETYKKICEKSGVSQIDTLSIAPSIEIATLVDETFQGSFRKMESVGIFEKLILRLLEADPKRGGDLLSYFLFERTYLEKMLDLGFEDARKKHDELVEFAERAIHDNEDRRANN